MTLIKSQDILDESNIGYNNQVEEQVEAEDLDLFQSTQLGYGSRSVFEVSLNIVNATVGAGVIGLPYALVLSGFTPGIILSIIVAVLTTGSLYSLIVCGRKIQVYSFASLAEVTMGRFGFYALNAMLFIQSAGSVISYIILIADTLPVLASLYIPQLPILGDRQFMTILISIFLVFPLNLFRSIGALARYSAFSVFLLPIMVLTVLIRAPAYSGKNDTPLFTLGKDPVAATGIMSFAFVCSQVAFSNYLSQKNQSLKSWSQTSGVSTFMSWIISISFAVVGYLSFGVEANSNIFSNFDLDDPVINVGRLSLGVSMIFTVPMAFYPARDAIQKTIGLESSTRQPSKWEHMVLTVVLFIFFLLLGVHLRSLGKVYSIVGGIASSFLAYIIPGFAYLAVFRPFSSKRHVSTDELVPFAKPYPITELDQQDEDIHTFHSSSWLLSLCSVILVLFGTVIMLLTTISAFK
ncbi:unnamed protein product [Cunninghamella echinulata]